MFHDMKGALEQSKNESDHHITNFLTNIYQGN